MTRPLITDAGGATTPPPLPTNPLAHARPGVLRALYLAAAYLVIAPYLFEIQRVLPFRLGDPDWRFGAAGFFLTAITTPLLGLALLALLAYFRGTPRAMRIVALLTGIASFVVVLALISFLRDLGPMVSGAPEPAGSLVRSTAMRTVMGSSLALLALLALTAGGWSAAKGREASAR